MKIETSLKDEVSMFCKSVERLSQIVSLYCQEGDQIPDQEKERWNDLCSTMAGRLKCNVAMLKEKLATSFLDNGIAGIEECENVLRNAISYVETDCYDLDTTFLKELGTTIKKELTNFLRNMGDDGFSRMFECEYGKFLHEAENTLKLVYEQDIQDLGYGTLDAKNEKLRTKQREKLFKIEPYGVAFHNWGRDKIKLARLIYSDKNTSHTQIHNFFHAYAYYELLEKKCNEPEAADAPKYKDFILHDNLYKNSVYDKLWEYVNTGLIASQRHWYIVYKVLAEKGWLTKKSQKGFIEQITSIYGSKKKCSSEDFKKVDPYYKNNKVGDWSLSDTDSPTGADEYIKIAQELTREFVDNKYVLPGKIIRRK